jgi:hypothetical protein
MQSSQPITAGEPPKVPPTTTTVVPKLAELVAEMDVTEVWEVGDLIEVFSQSMGGWQHGTVIEVSPEKVAVQYGERRRVMDLNDPKLGSLLRRAPPAPYAYGDVVEYFSESAGGWVRGTVEDAAHGKVALQYADGARQRIIDLSDPKLPTYFRPTVSYAVGEEVEVYSNSLEAWQKGVVVEGESNANGQLSVQYGERMRMVNLNDTSLASFFRPLQPVQVAGGGEPAADSDDGASAAEAAPHDPPARVAPVHTESNSLFASLRIAQEKLIRQQEAVKVSCQLTHTAAPGS